MAREVRHELPDPSYNTYTWLLQDEHAPAAQPPLIADIPAAAARETTGSGSPPARLIINGYVYQRADVSGSPFGNVLQPETIGDLVRWREEWLPQVEEVAQRLENFEPASVRPGAWETALKEQNAAYQRVFAGIHRTAVATARLVADRFMDAFVHRFGGERRQDALALLQGIPNLSLDRSTALWDLSLLLRADGALQEALDRSAQFRSDSPRAHEFREGLAAMLERFGCTTNSGLQDLPTWAENPTIPLAVVRGYAWQEDGRSPRAAATQQRERRLRLEGELRAQAEADPTVASLLPLLEMAQQFLPNLEDHNLLCDQRLTAASRARWLAVGRHIRGRGATASPDDVFYYRFAELIATLEGGEPPSREEVAERRALLALSRTMLPPRVLGRPLEAPPGAVAPSGDIAGGRVLRGAPASPGAYRGPARVILSLSEANRLVQGDVLVARSTTPPWTPLFGLVGAVVTEVGGALSHSAIVARELGIPAVVGAQAAMALIPDGAMVTVDGTTGAIVVEAGERDAKE